VNKVFPQTTVQCRECKDGVETLAHILGQCTFSKSSRFHRHNEFRDFLAKKNVTVSTEFQVIDEVSVETPSGTFKLDLLVIDVSAFQKDTGYLEECHNNKVPKYKFTSSFGHTTRSDTRKVSANCHRH
jgi:hypothetical protein